LHTWTFILERKSHKIEFWDSKISGKKKLALDDNVLKNAKDTDNFYYMFKLEGYNFSIMQKSDDKYEIRINDRLFTELMRQERSGQLEREKEEYLKKKQKEKKKKNNNNDDDYYKRAMKYNGENYFEGEEMYDIEEQRKRLEEFERKKQKEKKQNNFDDDDGYQENKNTNRNKDSQNFVLDAKTVNINRMIICNIKDIFDNDNFQEGGGNILDLNWNNNNNNDNNNNYNQNNNQNNFMQESMFNNGNPNNNNNYNKKILESNPDYYLNQMNNNLNNAKNPHNQAVLDQFFDLTNNNGGGNNNNNNNNNNNMSYNFNNQYGNNNNINESNNNYNMQFQNNNFSNQNNNNGNNNNFDDDFNPFDD